MTEHFNLFEDQPMKNLKELEKLIQLIVSMQIVAISSTINAIEKMKKLILLLEEARKLAGKKEYKDIERSVPFYTGYSIGYNDVVRQSSRNACFHLHIPFIENDRKPQTLNHLLRKGLGYFSAIAQLLGKKLALPLHMNLHEEALIRQYSVVEDVFQNIEWLLMTPGIPLEQRLENLRSIRDVLGNHHLTESENADYEKGIKAGERIALDKTRCITWLESASQILGVNIKPVIPYSVLLAITLPIIIDSSNSNNHKEFGQKSLQYYIGYLKGFDEFFIRIEKSLIANMQQGQTNNSVILENDEDSMELDDDSITATQLLTDIAITKTTEQPVLTDETSSNTDDAMEAVNTPNMETTTSHETSPIPTPSSYGHLQLTFFKPVETTLITGNFIGIFLPRFHPIASNRTLNFPEQESKDNYMPAAKRMKLN